ncbi:MAG: LytTR family transcriptional regulator [Bacteroidetes bacterium]|uniref:LytTR family transcriptional regulator n=1 Tax=Candidatus Cryptobacteroides excrementipullorum TaxID=2840761 RepID=A0A9D9IV72_9BACT|nr:LytTR family transcriptional regulator [Candidatus Cryptobacteroides excrementipullorum]
MKLLIEIGYVMLALLLLALIFVSFDYSFMESVFLGTLFLPGAFFLKFFIPQLALSHGKKRIADTFFLSMSVILFTFLLMVVSHLYIIPVSKFKQIWVNPIFTALILGLIAGGDMLMQRFRSRLSQKIPETVSFVSDRRKVSLNVDDIVYVESNDRDVYIHASDGATYRNKTPISQWENTLGEKFIRTHRAFLVNTGYIGGIEDESVCVKDEKIPVSRKYKDEVSRKMKA